MPNPDSKLDAEWLEIPAIQLLALRQGCNEALHCRAEAELNLVEHISFHFLFFLTFLYSVQNYLWFLSPNIQYETHKTTRISIMQLAVWTRGGEAIMENYVQINLYTLN